MLAERGDAFSLHVYFRKFGFMDPYSKHEIARLIHHVNTWERSVIGDGDWESDTVLGRLSAYTDEFLVGYLRMNIRRSMRRTPASGRTTQGRTGDGLQDGGLGREHLRIN